MASEVNASFPMFEDFPGKTEGLGGPPSSPGGTIHVLRNITSLVDRTSSLPSPALREMDYQVTVRYGRKTQKYLSLAVEARDAVSALRKAADGIPEEIASEIDIVELREAPDYEKTLPPSEGF
jgi:hypothetical protein